MSEKRRPGAPDKWVLTDKELEYLESMASIHCTNKEICATFGFSEDTLQQKFGEIIARGREKGKASVRRLLWKQATNGNSVALKYFITNVLKERLEDVPSKFGDDATEKTVQDTIDKVSTDMILQFVRKNTKAG